MEVTALCIGLIVNVLVLLSAEESDAAFLHVVPNRLQLFEYESISFDCEGFDDFTDWRVMRRIMGVDTICGVDFEKSREPCVISNALSLDSGEYWCEAKGGGRGNSVSIHVSAGPLILESPGRPVTEGDDVTLTCRNKMASSGLIADFYKNGTLKETGYEGNITILSVSKSDEGLYKCVISGVGESAESWLAVRVTLPLLLAGSCLCGKRRAFVCKKSTPRSASGLTIEGRECDK
ncbi:high affinity immunoglobulin gamma Fc receptor I-like [Anoplopoma fimbria]|uniref:high affinity immunoglobulin gamma Fc receptor I-like n=1 Tax=Anoplopoma fimbria TaxID=229290 RepID=UPI0023EAC019|nr:high affinity immunoglobulin gamma Fc receptor I-like [Anoplopoma fimbria]